MISFLKIDKDIDRFHEKNTEKLSLVKKGPIFREKKKKKKRQDKGKWEKNQEKCIKKKPISITQLDIRSRAS